MRPIIRLTLICLLAAPGCSREPTWKDTYEACKKKMGETLDAETAKMKRQAGNDEMSKAMAGAMGGMVTQMGLAACEAIKGACEKDPDSAACRQIAAAKI